MKIRKLVATTLFAIAATGITAATAYGQVEVSAPTFQGADGSIAYTTTLAPDHSNAKVTLASGQFSLTPDASAVNVLAPDGSVVGTVPMTLQTVGGRQVQVAPAIDSTGTP
jgi:hypothetical protein